MSKTNTLIIAIFGLMEPPVFGPLSSNWVGKYKSKGSQNNGGVIYVSLLRREVPVL